MLKLRQIGKKGEDACLNRDAWDAWDEKDKDKRRGYATLLFVFHQAFIPLITIHPGFLSELRLPFFSICSDFRIKPAGKKI